jgi:hypothetical protein
LLQQKLPQDALFIAEQWRRYILSEENEKKIREKANDKLKNANDEILF